MLYKRYINKLFSQNVRIILTIISECDFKSYYYARMSEVFLLFFRNVRINSTILSECYFKSYNFIGMSVNQRDYDRM